MDYLTLCQETVAESDIPTGQPTTVVDQIGQLGDVVRWVRDAWIELQNSKPNWRWMRRTATLNTVASDDTYAPADFTDVTDALAISRFSHWWADKLSDPPKIYLQGTGVGGERWVSWTSWDWFKTVYKIGPQTDSYPAHITFDPNNNIVLGPKPNGVYVLTLDYQMSAQTLAADADIPEMPSQYHKLIAFDALAKYAGRSAAPEALLRSEREGRPYRRNLQRNQLERMKLAEPLV